MPVEIRPLARTELDRVGVIDRSEPIYTLYVQDGVRLERRAGDWSAPVWDPVGEGEHSVAAQQRELYDLVERGAVAFGAFDDDETVGVGVVLGDVRPGVAQLAYLHVTRGRRAQGIGGRLADALERRARELGSTTIVVSATPSVNTVDFYRRRGYAPMAQPLEELLEREPDDIHLSKAL